MTKINVLPKVENRTLHARVYQELRNAIIRGHFAPGETVTIRRLATELGTSVMPVREAIHRLISERAIEMQSSRSMRIPLLTREKIEDLIMVRSIIEPEAVYLAAGQISEDDMLELEVLNKRLVKAILHGDVDDKLIANRAFHFAVYRLASSPMLLQVIDSLWLQSGPYLQSLFASVDRFHEDLGTEFINDKLLEAFRKGDARMAKRIREKDIRLSARWYLKHLED